MPLLGGGVPYLGCVPAPRPPPNPQEPPRLGRLLPAPPVDRLDRRRVALEEREAGVGEDWLEESEGFSGGGGVFLRGFI